MGELFSAGELISALLKVGKGTYNVAKFAGKVGYGAYAKAKERDELARLQRQAIVDETGVLEQRANWGYAFAQYEYGKALYCYGNEYHSPKDKEEGLQWIRKAAAKWYEPAQDFLAVFVED